MIANLISPIYTDLIQIELPHVNPFGFYEERNGKDSTEHENHLENGRSEWFDQGVTHVKMSNFGEAAESGCVCVLTQLGAQRSPRTVYSISASGPTTFASFCRATTLILW